MANRPHMRGLRMDRESIALKQSQNAALGFEVICEVVGGAPLSSVGHVVSVTDGSCEYRKHLTHLGSC